MIDKKAVIPIVVLLVIGAAAAVIADRVESERTEDGSQPAPAPEQTAAEQPAPGGAVSPSSPRPAPSKDTVFTYEQVVEQYEGYRIQFDASCRATPSNVTYKNNTKVMFDNRTAQKETISVDGKGYAVGPYGFIVLPLTSKVLPHTVSIGCNQKFNVAQILLQK